MARIYLEQVSRRFNLTTAIEQISFEVPDGQFWVLVGPSGCGKSTILRMIAGLETPTSGQIYIGERCVNQVPARLRDVAMVFQNYALYPHMSVAENLAFGLRLRGTDRARIQKQVEFAANVLGITHLLDRKPRQLSGGQQQRVALGRAIVRQPQVFLLDEPLSNLDAQLRDATRTELKQLHQQLGITTIYVTHDQVEAMTLADQIVVLDRGRIQQISDPKTLYAQPANQMVAKFFGSPPMNILPAAYRGMDSGIDSGTNGGTNGGTNSGTVLQVGEFRLPCPATLQATLNQRIHSSSRVNLGIRPEHLHITTADRAMLSATVTLIEPLGRESLVQVQVATPEPLTLQLWANASQMVRLGERLPLRLEPEQLLVFEPETGQNLSWDI